MKSFYITLPSGGEGNTTSSFTVHLPYQVDLPGQWEVALVDVIYPTSWLNVHERNNVVQLCNFVPYGSDGTLTEGCAKEEYTSYTLHDGYYHDIKTLVKHVNGTVKHFTKDDEHAGKFHIAYNYVNYDGGNKTVHMELHEDIADMLGHKGIYFHDTAKADMYPSLVLQNLYVYTDDLIEPQIVGDVRAELLCIIPAEERTLKSAHYTPHHLHYLPVARNNFNSITIHIRDVKGNPIAFNSGHSVVKLHFRRI